MDRLSKCSGFTLIELLIVVAIIAILALIAVPNFLEAQTRAKVARVRADFRSVATAIEAYAVDHNDYPRNWSGGGQLLTPDLSTPVAYLSTAHLLDPFGRDMETKLWHVYGYHRIVAASELDQFPPGSPWAPDGTSIDPTITGSGTSSFYLFGGNRYAFSKYGQWLLHSVGPDRVWWLEVADWDSHDTLYDPTNGTISFGNIARTQLDPEGKILFHAEP
jgi:prepilin-type N-terminal cleavage/methylation domain-containing protein